jgi:hypothetical protein
MLKFDTSVIELIVKRRSVRTYKPTDLDGQTTEKIHGLLQSLNAGPFGNKIRFSLIEKSLARENYKVKLGTYGFISGARYFIAGQVEKGDYANEDYGYLMETIILHLTDMHLGTCWLGGTFSRSDFEGIMEGGNSTFIPAVTPVGLVSLSMSLKERLIRRGAKADSRKNWAELFFNNTFNRPLTEDESDPYAAALEMVRLAPSASNKQPWRICKTSEAFHFYLKRTVGYGKYGKDVDLQKVDMGIAMSHFELSCIESDLSGRWTQSDPGIDTKDNGEYCVSWRI